MRKPFFPGSQMPPGFIKAIRSLSLFLLGLQAVVCPAYAQGLTGSIKGTVSANAGNSAARPELLSGASLTLTNRDVPTVTFKSVSDETGNFVFLELPAAIYTLTAEAKGLASVTREINLNTGATLIVEIILAPTVSESVTIREEEGLLSAGESTTSNTIRAAKLEQLPLRSDDYRGAAPLTPSVVRDTSGADHIKGTRAGENAYTVNGADVTDPVTGNLAFAIPLEAAGSVRIEDNPYSAEFGKATGGASNLETKSGGDKFKFGAARVFPTFHDIIGGKVDSFRPRVTFEGPLIRKRLNFLQSFEYRFSRIYVPSLPEQNDNSTSESFNSFTQFDLTVNSNNRLKLVGALFPEKRRYVGLNTFNPQETTPNTKQRGTLFAVSEQAIFQDKSFLSSLLAYKTFGFDVYGQGVRPMLLIPDENRGSYFADTRRTAKRWQWQEQYFARTFQLSGLHSFKLGGELDYTNLTGQFYFRPIEIRRPDLSLSQRIDFISPTDINRSLMELGGFIQDRWEINPTLTLDGGVRFDRNSISHKNEFSPRVSVLYRPFTNDRTIIRAGTGLFYARSALSTRYFEPENPNRDDDPVGNGGLGLSSQTNFPTRVVTTYDRDGQTILDGPREFLNVIRNPFRDARALRLSLQIDQRIGKHLTLRTGYVHRYTKNEPIITPELTDGGGGFLILRSRGVSRYNEFQALALYDDQRFHNWTISYTWSKAQGNLNTADNFLGDFPAFVVRPDQYGALPFDAPHRFLAYGEIKAPYGLTVIPALDIRSGFPYSVVNDRLDFVGIRNSERFPAFLSLDVTVLKSFTIPFLDKPARAGAIIFNLTDHFNPRDVQNNLSSLQFGQFFNSLGTSVRGKFEIDF
jgi:TonB dependent receptor-like, beta-barrel/Carboxypeptidase regulatory-like domain